MRFSSRPSKRFVTQLILAAWAALAACSASADAPASASPEPGQGSLPPIRWQTSAPGSLKPDGAGMVLTPTGGPMMVWGFMTPVGAPVTLKVGESLRFSFTYNYANPSNRFTDFRIGLFNFGGAARPSGRTFSSPDLKGYFLASGTQQANPTGSGIYAVDNAGNADGVMNHKSEKATPLGDRFPAISAGTEPHVASFTVTRTGEDSVDVTASIDAGNDSSFTSPDTTLKLTSFDCIAMFFGRINEDDSLIISNPKVEVVAP